LQGLIEDGAALALAVQDGRQTLNAQLDLLLAKPTKT
jgi:hypothetical protein